MNLFLHYIGKDKKSEFKFNKKKELQLIKRIYKNYIFKYVLIYVIQSLGLYKLFKKIFKNIN